MYDFMAGAGHHSFVKAGDEIFAVYHAFYNPLDNNENGSFMGRAIAIDRVQFVDSPYYDFDILQGNGPDLFAATASRGRFGLRKYRFRGKR